MSKHDTEAVTAALRSLDPAATAQLSSEERLRAEETFTRIVATPHDQPVASEPARPRRRRAHLLVAGALAGAAGIAAPVLLSGGTAYGSWTKTPTTLDASEAAEAAATCRSVQDLPNRGERVAVAERRGGWTYVVLNGATTETVCLMPQDLIGKDPADRSQFFGSHDTDRPAPPSVEADGIEETGSIQGSTDEGWFVSVEGYVGADVTGVTVHTSSGLEIEASVTDGRYAAWWPSEEQSSENPAETWTYTVHLTDGTIRKVG
ncbi:hypothetical protein ABIE44_002070 [Marmoricola sp. OAE513]|uniref:hypothetical protein n=1 Tax=Marmoricola sp. OAE513 TaxID=2817894 RepID=UPI001AE6603C